MNRNSGQKCIWMEAGIVKYKLCDQHFECENCSLHKSLSSSRALPDDISTGITDIKQCHILDFLLTPEESNTYIEQFFRLMIPGLICHVDRYYVPPFFWFLPQQKLYMMGIIPIWQLIIPKDTIVIKPGRSHFRKDEDFCSFQRKKINIAFKTPFSFKIHHTLETQPNILNSITNHQFPVWIISTDTPDLIKQQAIALTDIIPWYIRVLKLIKQKLLVLQFSMNDALTDGGEINQNLFNLLNMEEIQELISNIYALNTPFRSVENE
ncbi:MAG: hypothetical protein Kow00108_14320 [Calditrichia bacterium]